jgi:hypothetical protein
MLAAQQMKAVGHQALCLWMTTLLMLLVRRQKALPHKG